MMPAKQPKLLLVDDHEANLVALRTLLSQDGVEVLQAGSGREALEMLLDHDVALAIIDVHMPIMDGFELAELMRGSRRTQHVPIIFLTGESQDNLHRFRGYQAGAVDFLYKPIEPHVLRSKTAIFLDLFRQREELARQRDRFLTLAEEKARLLRERDEADQRLRDSESRFRLLADSAPVIIWMNGLEGVEFVNQACLNFFGVATVEEASKLSWLHYVHPDDQAQAADTYRRAVAERLRFETSFRCRRGDGVYRWMRTIGMPTLSPSEQLLGYIGASFDLTESKEAEERLQRWSVDLERAVNQKTDELRRSQTQLRALATELNLAEQKERKRLATELHDYLAQLLVFGRMKLSQAKRGNLGPATTLVKELDDMLDEALTYTRSLVAQLSPPVLREFGLVVAIKWLAEQMRRHEMTVTVQCEADLAPLREDQAVLIFQSARELLINVSKHAKTSQASISVWIESDMLHLCVGDEGVGFDLASTTNIAAPMFGLFSIRERMEALGGRMAVESAPGRGTKITLVVPYVGGSTATDVHSRAGNALASSQVSEPEAVSVLDALAVSPGPQSAHSSRTRVLLVDDHAMLRQGVRTVLEGYPDIEIVGEANNGEQALLLAQSLQPKIVIMDINMPDMDGIEATRRLKLEQPETLVIGLSVHNDWQIEEAMRAAGAVSFLPKDAAIEQLHETIQVAIRAAARTA